MVDIVNVMLHEHCRKFALSMLSADLPLLPMQGVMMLPPTSLPSEGQSAVYKRLWVHEVFRVFCDRLVDDAERVWLLQQVCMPSALLQAFSDMASFAPPGFHLGSRPLQCQ